jgi:hypothetical protein
MFISICYLWKFLMLHKYNEQFVCLLQYCAQVKSSIFRRANFRFVSWNTLYYFIIGKYCSKMVSMESAPHVVTGDSSYFLLLMSLRFLFNFCSPSLFCFTQIHGFINAWQFLCVWYYYFFGIHPGSDHIIFMQYSAQMDQTQCTFKFSFKTHNVYVDLVAAIKRAQFCINILHWWQWNINELYCAKSNWDTIILLGTLQNTVVNRITELNQMSTVLHWRPQEDAADTLIAIMCLNDWSAYQVA